MFSIKLITTFILVSMLASCASFSSSNSPSEHVILGRYLEYILVIENDDIAERAKDFLSEPFYEWAKDELKNNIDLTQRDTIQLTYMPLSQLKSYEFSTFNNIYCLKLNGYDVNQRKISLLLDYILEDEKWKIHKFFAGYLDGDLTYNEFPPCIEKAIDSV